MSGLTSLVLNVVAGAYVPGTRDNVEPQLLLAGWAGAGGAHDYRAAQPRWELRSAPEYYAAPATQSKLSSDLYVTSCYSE